MTGLFSSEGPRWYSIPSGRSFLDDLARGLYDDLGPLGLSEAQILTPTRRGARAMARAFSELAHGGALLLPQVRAIGDLDEGEPPFDLEFLALDLPPALSSTRRRFELARLVMAHYRPDDYEMTSKVALELASSLCGFFDSLALEEVDASDRLDDLVHHEAASQYVIDEWAKHWQVSAKFLSIVVHEWPRRLNELGLMDPSQRRVALIRKLGEQWTLRPPQHPLVLAGSTGTAPSMADLMGLVANLPQGAVVLPGLDLSLDDKAWRQVEDSHPQGAMKRLLERHGVARVGVKTWPASVETERGPRARRRLLNEALRPAQATEDWLQQIATMKSEADASGFDPFTEGLRGLNLIEARQDEDAAAQIAVLMRETLEMPDKIAALITPDIGLARRVSAHLSRWGLAADSSAGEPLAHSLTGRFLLDVLALAVDPLDPVRLLSVLKHPFGRYRDQADLIDRVGLRTVRPRDMAEVTSRLDKYPEVQGVWLDFSTRISAWQDGFTAPRDLSDFVRTFVATAETLTREDGQMLWQGAAGASASALLSGLITEGEGFEVTSADDFADIVGHMIKTETLRTGGNTHPRLLILGAIEARLVKADRLILAGLEDGVWPQSPPLDPFLTRPMRKALGLPSPERRTGLAAHDFIQAASAEDVWLITRKRREGEPQVMSRWLWRLKTLCQGAKVAIADAPHIADWAHQLSEAVIDAPDSLKPAARPDPRPPAEVRPNSMSVTEVEKFVRDPYAIYARRILNLRLRDRANEPFEQRRRGNAVHEAAENFVLQGHPLGAAGEAAFIDLMEQALRAENLTEAEIALQRPLFGDWAQHFVAFEAERRAGKPRFIIEKEGAYNFETAQGTFTLKARADRIEVREDGIDILDFKTGQPPSAKEAVAGFFPQLTLTAAIVKYGLFDGMRHDKPIGDLLYVRLSPDGAKLKPVAEKGMSSDELADQALDKFKTRIEAYGKASQPYRSWVAPKYLKKKGDYDQLARLYEWHIMGDEDASSDAPAEDEA
ncbi:double-strand break repair protein AddB [Asticcacaulis endophyticus]|uniref:Double-strand break repair protein AddB n=1 Tax=Asticcacaulis endophyticus TaxID=1395890 RepID=A0A918PU80_9CAUL|nr:double-strand break repair protein AddB [Asticcacaulis endophyticus]GGZ23359.1 double-strand break repair protein AddB [Asticcacaulis endophyticus]